MVVRNPKFGTVLFPTHKKENKSKSVSILNYFNPSAVLITFVTFVPLSRHRPPKRT